MVVPILSTFLNMILSTFIENPFIHFFRPLEITWNTYSRDIENYTFYNFFKNHFKKNLNQDQFQIILF